MATIKQKTGKSRILSFWATILCILAAGVIAGGICFWQNREDKFARSEYSEELVEYAEDGDAGAQNALGRCYYFGYGVGKNYHEAVKWWKKAAAEGHADAQHNLGYCYDSGNGVSQDYHEAVRWYRKAAKRGHIDAQYNLGVCYANGNGVDKNDNEAVEWWKKAA